MSTVYTLNTKEHLTVSYSKST